MLPDTATLWEEPLRDTLEAEDAELRDAEDRVRSRAISLRVRCCAWPLSLACFLSK